jgi:hypothetical protein
MAQKKTKKGVNPKKSLRNKQEDDTLPGMVKNSLQVIPRQVGLILPDRYFTRLRYWTNASTNLSATPIQGLRMTPTNAYDVNPALGSTSMAGFAELAALYGQYRVTCSRIKIQLVNPSTSIPIEAIIIPLNYDPGASPSTATVVAWKENPYSKSKMTPLVGGPATTLICDMSTEKINGSKMVYFDDSFAALVTTGPVNNWFWGIGFAAPAVIATLVYFDLTVDLGIEFFGRRPLNN